MPTENDSDLFSQIPGPSAQPSTRPDIPTAQAIGKKHRIVRIILIIIASLGVLLVCIAIAAHLVVKSLEAPPESLGHIRDSILGLGIELASSAGMLAFFYFVLEDSKRQVWHVLCGVVVGAVFFTAAIFTGLYYDPFVSSIFVGIGVEVTGAMVVFSVLENVIKHMESIQRQR